MTFCLHDLPIKKSSPGRSAPFTRKQEVPHASLLLRLIENHLARVQRLHGLLAKRVTHPEEPAGEMVLDYGIEPDTLDRTPGGISAPHLVASSPAIGPYAVPFIPPPPPRLTPLAVAVLRKRLAFDAGDQPAVQLHHTIPHILPSLFNQKIHASAQSHTLNNRSHPGTMPKLTTNLRNRG